MPKEDSHCICLSLVLLDSVFIIGRDYYQVFFKARKCNVKENELDIFLRI